ncbi:MAG: alpha/beta hydrolase [Cyanobacteria bacterium J06638_20]
MTAIDTGRVEAYPLPTDGLTEETSIALAQQVQRVDVQTALMSGAIATTFVQCGTASAEPLLLLHGFDSSVLEFRRLLPLLAAHHETWAIDLLGFGFTQRLRELAVTPEAIVQHLYDFWAQQIQRPVTLVGASMGGTAAIAFAHRYPDAVSRLVLLDSAGYTVGPSFGNLLPKNIAYWVAGILKRPKVRQNIAVKAYHDPSFASEDAAQCAALHLAESLWQETLAVFTRSGGFRSCRLQLPELQMPTLILWGRSDRILGIKDAPKLAEAIPQSRLVWVEASGHVPHLEQPAFTAAEILKFMA